MSVIHDIWIEELDRMKRLVANQERFLGDLERYPKGSIHQKMINGRPYDYLFWRDGGKVRSRYLGNDPEQLKRINVAINARKEKESDIKRMKLDIKLLERAIKMKVKH